jgi:hypothetical protein
MAERRMFAKSVIGSARFLRMPASSRLLYYDLGMQADDDGVVEAFAVMRTTGATEDDLRVLASKSFVRVLNDDLVTLISDWSKNNYIQRDRYHPSHYQDLLVQLGGDLLMDTSCIQNVSEAYTEVRLGKDRVGKDRVEENTAAPHAQPAPIEKPNRSRFVPPTLAEVQSYVAERHSPVDPQGFIDFYAAKGWMVGRAPMKDWKAACRNAESWERWQKKPAKSDKPFIYDPGDTTGSL